ncbi:MAG: hypothetical protein ACYS22_16650 [Planctomycetota bacterium]
MNRQQQTALLGGIALVATAGVLWFALGRGARTADLPPESSEARDDATPLDAEGATLRPGEAAAPEEGPQVPRPAPPRLLLEQPDLTSLQPEARKQLAGDMRRYVGELVPHLERGDWEQVREASRQVRKDPRAFSEAASEMLRGGGVSPREVLLTGLIFEELADDDTIADETRKELGDALVPRLFDEIDQRSLTGDDARDAIRITSRFPESQSAEDRLLALIVRPDIEEPARIQALYGLADVGTERSLPELFRIVDQEVPLERVRVAGQSLLRIADRLQSPGLRGDVAGRVEGTLRRALIATLAREEFEVSSNLALTLGELRRLAPPVYLAEQIVGQPDAPEAAIFAALELVGTWRDSAAVPALESHRQRMGNQELEELLEAVIARLRALDTE